jgi:predicted small metal-binding protein
METEIKTIERLIRQGSSDEELFEKYPKHIDHIKSYREFLDKQISKNKKETYKVIVAETFSNTYYIEANSEEEAEEKVFTHEILFDPDEKECVERELTYIEIY